MQQRQSIFTIIPPLSKSLWPDHIPIELYTEIRAWLSDLDYWRFMMTSKSKFHSIKKETIKFTLDISPSRGFLKNSRFTEKIISKISTVYQQLTLKTSSNLDLLPTSELKFSIILIAAEQIHSLPNFIQFLSNRMRVEINHNDEISNLFSLENVRFLRLVDCNRICDFAGMKNIQEVAITRCQNLSDLSNFGNLYKLRIEKCFRVTSLCGLGNVHSLEIVDCENLLDISDITFKNFSVSIIGSNHIRDLSPLLQVTWLETDAFDSWREPVVDEPMNLKRLTLMNCLISSFNFSSLFSLHLYSCLFSDICGMENVALINITYCPYLVNISKLAAGRHKSVTLEFCPSVSIFEAVSEIPMVKIRDSHNLCHGMELQNVKYLTIEDCPNLKDVSMFHNCRFLRIHSLFTNLQLMSLKGLSNIEEIQIGDVSHNVPLLKALQNNRKIVLLHRPTITLFLQVVEKVPKFFPITNFEVIHKDNTCILLRKSSSQDIR